MSRNVRCTAESVLDSRLVRTTELVQCALAKYLIKVHRSAYRMFALVAINVSNSLLNNQKMVLPCTIASLCVSRPFFARVWTRAFFFSTVLASLH